MGQAPALVKTGGADLKKDKKMNVLPPTRRGGAGGTVSKLGEKAVIREESRKWLHGKPGHKGKRKGEPVRVIRQGQTLPKSLGEREK